MKSPGQKAQFMKQEAKGWLSFLPARPCRLSGSPPGLPLQVNWPAIQNCGKQQQQQQQQHQCREGTQLHRGGAKVSLTSVAIFLTLKGYFGGVGVGGVPRHPWGWLAGGQNQESVQTSQLGGKSDPKKHRAATRGQADLKAPPFQT